VAMDLVEELEAATGYTADEIRARLRMLQPVLVGCRSHGAGGGVRLSEAVLELLLHMARLEGGGTCPSAAAAEVVKEQKAGDVRATQEEEALRDALRRACRERDLWKELALSLHRGVDAFAPPRPWWARAWGRARPSNSAASFQSQARAERVRREPSQGCSA